MTNLEKAKELLQEFEVLEEELNDLLKQLQLDSVETLKYPLQGRLRLLQRQIEVYNNFNKLYTGKTH